MAEFFKIRGMSIPEEITNPPRAQHLGMVPYNPGFAYQNQPGAGVRPPMHPGQVPNQALPPNYEGGINTPP